jgi:periplasmic divalent cation tolerance protein
MLIPKSPSHLVVLTTVSSEAAARTLVQGLVGDRLIACGTIFGPARSIYRWEGKIGEEGETVIMMKTHSDRWGALRAAIRDRHPYDVPELLALPVADGLDAYLDWVTQSTREGETVSP